MAISKVVTTVIDVGQGQCTFVRIYDDSSPPKIIHTLLFDCGSDRPSPTTANNIRSIADFLKLMDAPAIDLLVFSHSDNDHISLMYDLLEAYGSKTKPALKVLSTWFAGDADFYTKDKFNILDYLGSYCKSFTKPDFGETQYSKAKSDWKKGLVWESADKSVRVGMLIGNVIDNEPGVFKLTTFGTAAEKKNRVSIVCALLHDDRSMIICGDATNRTMAWVNDAMGTDSFTTNLMLTLPHHGSRSTGLSVTSTASANKKAIDVVKTFVKRMAPRTITTSAYAMHDHPSIELTNYFTKALATSPVLKDTRLTGSNHFSVCNVDVSLILPSLTVVSKTYHTMMTQTNFFPTYYYNEAAAFSYQFAAGTVDDPPKFVTPKKKPAINPHACWVYVTTAGSGNSVAGFKQMPATNTSKFTNDGTVPETVSSGTAATGTFDPSVFFPPLLFEPTPTPRRTGLPALNPLMPSSSSLVRLRAFR